MRALAASMEGNKQGRAFAVQIVPMWPLVFCVLVFGGSFVCFGGSTAVVDFFSFSPALVFFVGSFVGLVFGARCFSLLFLFLFHALLCYVRFLFAQRL